MADEDRSEGRIGGDTGSDELPPWCIALLHHMRMIEQTPERQAEAHRAEAQRILLEQLRRIA